jgi:hypothetical protein
LRVTLTHRLRGSGCAVCQDECEPGASVIALPACRHLFHADCLLPWLARKHTCPVCRSELPAKEGAAASRHGAAARREAERAAEREAVAASWYG